MARAQIARMRGGKVREVTLVFEGIETKPVRRADGVWEEVPVDGQQYALYWEAGQYSRKMYFESTEEAMELVALIGEELGMNLKWDGAN